MEANSQDKYRQWCTSQIIQFTSHDRAKKKKKNWYSIQCHDDCNFTSKLFNDRSRTQTFARICTGMTDKKSTGFDQPRKTITITGHLNTNYVR